MMSSISSWDEYMNMKYEMSSVSHSFSSYCRSESVQQGTLKIYLPS